MRFGHSIRFCLTPALSDYPNQLESQKHTLLYSTTQRVKSQVKRQSDTRQRDWQDREKSRGNTVKIELVQRCKIEYTSTKPRITVPRDSANFLDI